MRILALETSAQAGSVALLEGDLAATPGTALARPSLAHIVLAQRLDPQSRSAQTLAPAIDAALRVAGWSPQDVQLIAVTVGPGSFTGLRVGVTTAKTFAYAIGAEVLGMNTLQAIASQADGPTHDPALYSSAPQSGPLFAVLDAQRRELFVQEFRLDSTAGQGLGKLEPQLQAIDSPKIVSAESWIPAIPAGATVTGSGLARWRDLLPASVRLVPEDRWQPTAETVGQLAWRDYQTGRRDDLWGLLPLYYRLSAAEEAKGLN